MSERNDPLNPILLLLNASIAETTNQEQAAMLKKFHSAYDQWSKEVIWDSGMENTPIPETRQKIAECRAHAEVLLTK